MPLHAFARSILILCHTIFLSHMKSTDTFLTHVSYDHHNRIIGIFSVWLNIFFAIVRLTMPSFVGGVAACISSTLRDRTSHPRSIVLRYLAALNLRGMGGDLITFHCFITRLFFLICRLVGFAGDALSRGVVHRSLYCAGNKNTLFCEFFLAPNASKRVGIHVFDIMTARF